MCAGGNQGLFRSACTRCIRSVGGGGALAALELAIACCGTRAGFERGFDGADTTAPLELVRVCSGAVDETACSAAAKGSAR